MSILAIGVIEGIAEATAAIVKVFSGALSDWIGRRKPLVILGYGLAALTKPLFPLASGISLIVTARFVDRIGKGIRGAPRDALIADVTPPEQRGSAYGLRQSLDTIGAFVGPLLALALMAAFAGDIRMVLWVAVIPALLSVACIVLFVREPEKVERIGRRRIPLAPAELARLPKHYWWVLVFASVLTLARFSEAFLVLRAHDIGLALAWVPVVMVVMNVVYAVAAIPAGIAADRISRRSLLLWGLGVLVVADLVLAGATGAIATLAGAGLWGLHMGLTQGLLSALVADAAPSDLRGTAFGVFNLASGAALLIASSLAGLLWTMYGPGLTFVMGAVFTSVAAMGLVVGAPQAKQ
ncbi:MAG: MFS transporter, partial [Burkholderiales bacterium]|nr:MFS transporter [Burkholderiales bacterium]